MADTQIDLVSNAKLSSMATMEKIRYIIDETKKGKILVLENGLLPEEETKLIEMTMSEIDSQEAKYTGIEVQSYPSKQSSSIISKLFNRSTKGRMTIIGPASSLHTIKKDANIISEIIR
jgi:hypothetical protein